MNWGKGIALTLIAFAALMAWFIVMAARNPEPLVSDTYYQEELGYQQRIDAEELAMGLSEPVSFAVQGDRINLRFPAEVANARPAGELVLHRPNDPGDDLQIAVATTTEGTFVSGPLTLHKGVYDAELEWHAGGLDYHSGAKLFVP